MKSEAATRNQPVELPPAPVRKRARGLSVRVLMMLVLVVGGVLGWIAHRARVQRDAVAAIEAARGRVDYNWSFELGRNVPSKFPRLERILGPDFFENVTRVNLGSPGAGPSHHVDDALMRQVAHLTKLQRLEVNSADISDDTLASIRGLHDLRYLNLTTTKVTHIGPENFGGFPKLEYLWLHCNHAKHVDLTFLQDLTSLKSLRLIHQAEKTDLQSLEHLKHLNRLTLMHPVGDDDLAHLAGLVNLEHLSLDGRNVTNTGLRHLRHLRRLRALSISLAPITSLQALQGLSSLEVLNLFRTRVDDAGISALENLPSLRTLNLRAASLTDAGLVHLRGLTGLTSLDLSENAITDAGLMQLSGLTSCRELIVQDTQVTPAGVRALQAKCPTMVISR